MFPVNPVEQQRTGSFVPNVRCVYSRSHLRRTRHDVIIRRIFFGHRQRRACFHRRDDVCRTRHDEAHSRRRGAFTDISRTPGKRDYNEKINIPRGARTGPMTETTATKINTNNSVTFQLEFVFRCHTTPLPLVTFFFFLSRLTRGYAAGPPAKHTASVAARK